MKGKNLLVACAVIFCVSAIVVGQGAVLQHSTVPKPARQDGGAEQTGDPQLTVNSGTSSTGSIQFSYTTSINRLSSTDATCGANGISPSGAMWSTTAADCTVSGSTITVANIVAGVGVGGFLRLSGVRVSTIGLGPGDTVQETASTSGGPPLGGNSIIAGQQTATVISSIRAAKVVDLDELDDTMQTLLTTGGSTDPLDPDDSVHFIIEEGGPSLWTALSDELGGTTGYMLEFTFTDLPDEAVLTIQLSDDSNVAGDVIVDGTTLWTGGAATNTIEIVGDGTDQEVEVEFSAPNTGATETLEFLFDLDISSNTDVDLPLPEGEVGCAVTNFPTDDDEVPWFVQDLMPSPPGACFKIVKPECTLLFRHLAVVAGANIDTGIAIDNSTGEGFGGAEELDGTVDMWLFPNDGAAVNYTTGPGSPGSGLNSAGEVEAGGTWVVLLSDILDDAGFSGDFQGHAFATTDFTHCHGVGFAFDGSTFFLAHGGVVLEVPRPSGTTADPESGGQ